MSRRQGVTILGIFVVDLAFRAGRLPVMGETILGDGFTLEREAAPRLGSSLRGPRRSRAAVGDGENCSHRAHVDRLHTRS